MRHAAAALRAFTFALVATVAAASAVSAKPRTWDRTANIKASAIALAALQQAKGAMGAYQFIANCYQTHALNSEYGAALEGCLVQDYIHSKVTAAVYSNLPAGERERLDLPVPNELVDAMLKRVGAALAQYKISEVDARKFVAQVDAIGVPTFAKARFQTPQ